MENLNINGRNVVIDAPPDMPLLWLLRDVAGMTVTKFGCGMGFGRCCIFISQRVGRLCT